MVDVIAAVLVVLFGYLGWRRGFMLSVLPFIGLVLGYVAAYLLYRPAGRVVGSLFDLQPLLSYPIGGAVVFVLVVVLFNVAGLAVRKRRAGRRVREGGTDLANRAGGAALGAAYGLVFALLCAWALLSLQALVAESHPDGFGPEVRGTLVGRMAMPLAEGVARKLAGGQTGDRTVGNAAASFARDPLRATRDLSGVLSDQRLQKALRNKPLMRRLARDPGAAARSPQLGALARDPDFVDRLRRLGLVQSAEAGELPPEEIVRQLTRRLRPTAQLLNELARDREVQELLEDPELNERLEERDIMALANDKKFNRLVEIITTRMRAINEQEPPLEGSDR